MAATNSEDIHGLAGEFVLGTLNPDERHAAEERLRTDPSFRAAVAALESRLQPIADAEVPLSPVPDLFDRIEARLSALPPATRSSAIEVTTLKRSLFRWRIGTGLMTAVAAMLVVAVAADHLSNRHNGEYVAVLTSAGEAPAFVATVDLGAGTLVLRRVGSAAAPPDHTYQLWAIAPNATPRSLGTVQQARLVRKLPAGSAGDLTVAISVEPPGGSPTGLPTGPVVFSGKLVSPDN